MKYLSKKKILLSGIVILTLGFMILNMCLSSVLSGSNSLMSLSRIEQALSDGTENTNPMYWKRSANNCTHIYSGATGSTVTLPNGGTLTLNSLGLGLYLVINGEVHCEINGTEQCTAANCTQ
jgi:hypothetical protein